MSKTKAPLGASLVVLSSIFYASYGIWTKLMGDFFDGYTASALRSVLVVLMLLPIAVVYRRLEPIKLRVNWKYIAGILGSGLFTWGPLYYAIQHAGVGISLAVNYASLVLGLFFFGWLIIRERFTKDKAISGLLGLVGLGFIFSPGTAGLSRLALVAAVVSGMSAAAAMVCSKQLKYNSTQSTLVWWATSIVSNFAMAFVFSKSWPTVGWHAEWLYLVFFATASVIASWSLIRGMKLIDAGAAGILGLLEIVFGVVFGVAFFGERPGLAVLAGVLAIVTAAAIPYIKDYNAQRGTLE